MKRKLVAMETGNYPLQSSPYLFFKQRNDSINPVFSVFVIVPSHLSAEIFAILIYFFLQETHNIILNTLTSMAVHVPPQKQEICLHQIAKFFQNLGYFIIVSGDYNQACLQSSKVNSPRGKTLKQIIRTLSLDTLTTNTPIYWPAAYNKSSNLLDFCIIKGFNKSHF